MKENPFSDWFWSFSFFPPWLLLVFLFGCTFYALLSKFHPSRFRLYFLSHKIEKCSVVHGHFQLCWRLRIAVSFFRDKNCFLPCWIYFILYHHTFFCWLFVAFSSAISSRKKSQRRKWILRLGYFWDYFWSKLLYPLPFMVENYLFTSFFFLHFFPFLLPLPFCGFLRQRLWLLNRSITCKINIAYSPSVSPVA